MCLVLAIGLSPISVQTVAAGTVTEIPNGYTPVYTFEDLYNIRSDTSGNYILMNDIDLSETAEGGKYDCGTGWASIPSFSGIFDGNGYSIRNLNIYGSRNTSYAGLFEIMTGTVKNLHMDNVFIDIQLKEEDDKNCCIGSIAGYHDHGTIANCSVSGTIAGNEYVGGVCGYSIGGKITNCTVLEGGTITGNKYVGGVCGKLDGESAISECYNAADIKGETYGYVGGIAGLSGCDISIANSYNHGNVEGDAYSYIGGITGYINMSYDVYQHSYFCSAKVMQCYSKTFCSSVGYYYNNNQAKPKIQDCYYMGTSSSEGRYGTSLTDWQMKLKSSYEGFDFDNVWTFAEGSEYPQLINNPERIVKNISLYSVPTKIKYYPGEEFSSEGAKIKVTFSNKSYSATVPVTEDMVSGIDTSVVGEQTATVTYKGFTVEFPVTIIPVTAERIEFSESKISVDVGSTYQLNTTISPDNTTDKTIVWTTTDERIATVENGVVTGIKAGTVEITATTSNGKSVVCTVTVLQPALEITLNTTKITLDKGKTEKVSMSLNPSNATDNITYTSNNKDVCTVDADGVVTAIGVGEALITVSTHRGLSRFCTITVTSPAESISLSQNNAEIIIGNSITFSRSMLPLDTTDSVTWTSSNPSICSVNERGIVTGVSKGTAIITATTTSGKSDSCIVTVKTHAGGHTIIPKEAVAPTCTKTGLTEGSYCSVCDEFIIEQRVIPATGHNIVVDKAVAPTCTKTGLTEGSHCSVCGEVIIEQKAISATGHNIVADKALAPTCTKTGLTEGSHCSICDEIIIKQKVISATGHSFGEWFLTKTATCTKEGEMTRSCSVLYTHLNHTY